MFLCTELNAECTYCTAETQKTSNRKWSARPYSTFTSGSAVWNTLLLNPLLEYWPIISPKHPEFTMATAPWSAWISSIPCLKGTELSMPTTNYKEKITRNYQVPKQIRGSRATPLSCSKENKHGYRHITEQNNTKTKLLSPKPMKRWVNKFTGVQVDKSKIRNPSKIEKYKESHPHLKSKENMLLFDNFLFSIRGTQILPQSFVSFFFFLQAYIST